MLLLSLLLLLPVLAQDDAKVELIRQLNADGFIGMRNGVVVDKLMDFKMTPAWYEKFSTDKDARNSMSNLAGSLAVVCRELGLGDFESLDVQRDSTNPLFLAAVDAAKPKVHCTLIIDKDLDANGTKLLMERFDTMLYPIQWAKPKSGKYFLTIKFEPMAKEYSYKRDKTGSNFTLIMPVYANASQSYIQESVQRGN